MISDLRKVIRRGDVWCCNLDKENGKDCRNRLNKTRYCLVVSSDEWNSVVPINPLILPFTTQEHNWLSEEISCNLGISAKAPISYLRTNSLQSVQLSNCLSFMGSMSPEKMKEIDAHLAKSLGIATDINKCLDTIAELKSEVLSMQEREKCLLSNLNKDIQTEASELVLENERLKDEIFNLKHILKYRDKQLNKFSMPIHNESIEINDSVIISKAIPATVPVQQAIAENESKSRRKGKITNTTVMNTWSATKAKNFVKYSEDNDVKSTMSKYGILSLGSYYKVLATCRSKVCISQH